MNKEKVKKNEGNKYGAKMLDKQDAEQTQGKSEGK